MPTLRSVKNLFCPGGSGTSSALPRGREGGGWGPSRWINGSPRRLWFLLAAAGLLLFLFGLANHGLWGAEEPYVGGIIREMADAREWVVPTLNGLPYLEKPPLYYLVGVAAARLCSSFAPWVLRLPSALFALATLVWIAWLAARRESPAAGWWAAICLATSDLFFRVGHKAVVDMSLVFAVSLGLGLVWLMLEEPERRSQWTPWFWISLALAFLAKGPVGPVLVLLPLAVHLALTRDRRLLRDLLRPQWGMACAALLSGGWVVMLYHRGGWPYLEEALVRNTVGRFFQLPGLVPATGQLRQHQETVLFYFKHSPLNLLPWLLLVVPAMAQSRRRPGGGRFLLAVLLVDAVFLSVSGMRRAVYFLPLVPVIFLCTGLWLERRIRGSENGGPDRTLANLVGVTGLLVFLAVAVGPWFFIRPYGLSWKLTMGCTLLAGGLAVLAAWRRADPRWLMDHVLGIWLVGMVFMNIVMPPLKDRNTRMADKAFWAARERVQSVGADVWEAGLTESDLGLGSLILRRPMPSVQSLSQIRALMAQGRPVVVLVAPRDLPAYAGLTQAAAVVRPEVPDRGVQGLGLCLMLNRPAAMGYPASLAALPPVTSWAPPTPPGPPGS
ncbi:MAG: glycosyltransferase family 39 protein [Holophaga sp.]|nr:glycosyltransferase family 39 protein [Holophaga sp.]